MAELTCPHCGAPVAASDVYCPNCTRSLRLAAPAPSEVSHGTPGRSLTLVVTLGIFAVCALALVPLVFVPAMRLKGQNTAGPFPPPPASSTPCMSNIKQLSVAALIYQADYDDRMFPRKVFEPELMPYVKNPPTFYCPDTGKPYTVNDHLLGLEMGRVADLAKTPMFYEGASFKLSGDHGGSSHVAYGDSHVKRVSSTATLAWKPTLSPPVKKPIAPKPVKKP